MKRIIFFLAILTLIYSCKTTGPEDPVPPKRILMVERPEGADTLEYVKGISTLPGIDNKIQIMWHKPRIEENIKSFKIYRSIDKVGLINYNLYFTLGVNNPGNPDTIFTDINVEIGTAYHYFIKAVNNDDLESEPSDTVSFKLLNKATLLAPQTNITIKLNRGDSLAFHWHREFTPPYYIIRIEQNITTTFHPLVYVKKIFNTEYDPDQKYILKNTIVEEVLEEGINYRWRIDAVEDPEIPTENPLVKIYAESQSEYFNFKVDWLDK